MKKKSSKIVYRILVGKIVLLYNSLLSTYKFKYIKFVVDSKEIRQDLKTRIIVEDSVQEDLRKNILVSFRDSIEKVRIQLSDVVSHLANCYTRREHIKKVGKNIPERREALETSPGEPN